MSTRDGWVTDVTERGGPETPTVATPPGEASFGFVLRDQRKTIFVGAVLGVAAFWVLGQLGEWTLAASLAVGVVLGLLNHLATEYWGLRVVTSGEQLTRNRLVMSTLARLVVISVVAVAVAVWLWPDGIGVFFGLAIFRLIALTMTTVPLLKELKNQ